jgi:hypothetical protein
MILMHRDRILSFLQLMDDIPPETVSERLRDARVRRCLLKQLGHLGERNQLRSLTRNQLLNIVNEHNQGNQ